MSTTTVSPGRSVEKGARHGQFGTHLSRGAIYYIAYRWNGREYRESTRSTERRVAERPLASRVADGRGRGHHGPLTFDHLAAWYLDDYLVRRLRTVDTARGRVANLRATFGGQPATVMTTEAIRSYQRTRNCNTWGKGDIRGEPSRGSRRSRTSRPGERPA